MANRINEIEALLQIDKLFSELSEDEQLRIFEWLIAKYKFSNKKKGTQQPFHSNLNHSSDSVEKEVISIKEFIAQKKPSNFYERIACIAYFLEKINGLESFKTADITKANLEARLNKIPNPALYVADSVKSYGFLTAVGSARKAISLRGEALVEALPDREKVTEVMKEYSHKRKNKKSQKKV